MSTLATMKAEIADDLDRDDLTSQIATAISRAIKHFRDEQFWFCETRNLTITTVADTTAYTTFDAGSDVSDVADVMLIRDVFSNEDGQLSKLRWITIEAWELMNDNSASTGEPYYWTLSEDTLRVYPVPDDDGYTLRLHAFVRRAEPAADDEAGNVWMTHAYELVRSEAKRRLAVNVLRDIELAQLMERERAREYSDLVSESNRRIGTGVIRPCD